MTAGQQLELITIPSPCSVPWETMQGNDRVRLCGQCDKNVYHVAFMSAEEAWKLIQNQEGEVCVQLWRRADGTLITQDCPPEEPRWKKLSPFWTVMVLVSFWCLFWVCLLLLSEGCARDMEPVADRLKEMLGLKPRVYTTLGGCVGGSLPS